MHVPKKQLKALDLFHSIQELPSPKFWREYCIVIRLILQSFLNVVCIPNLCHIVIRDIIPCGGPPSKAGCLNCGK